MTDQYNKWDKSINIFIVCKIRASVPVPHGANQKGKGIFCEEQTLAAEHPDQMQKDGTRGTYKAV